MSQHTDQEVQGLFERAFGEIPRPEHFTNHRHCDECREHDELLRARTRESLAIEDVGSQAWNPITMTTPEAFAYWLPALARLALEPMPAGRDWYGYIILYELRWDGPRNVRWQFCNAEQRSAVCALLEHLFSTREERIAGYDCADVLIEVLGIWADTGTDEAND